MNKTSMSDYQNKLNFLENSKSETTSSFITFLIPSKQEYCI
jgi:hypothetical protein